MVSESDVRVADPALLPIREKILAGEWLDFADGQALYGSRDLFGIGRLAHHVRTEMHGNAAFYNRNRHINYTNVCALSCKFCSFYRKRGEAGAYEMPAEQVIATAVQAAESGATEVHIVGGLHPWLKFDYYLDVLRGIRTAAPRLHIKAFTAIEIVHFSRISRMSIRDTLTALRDAGLGSLPGGGAEIFDDRVHDEAFKGKVREDKWFEVHRTAHELGIYTNATMLYGHIEGTAERVRHMMKLREVQEEATKRRSDGATEGMPADSSPSSLRRSVAPSLRAHFNCVIPLSFIPDHSELGHLPGPTGLTDLKTLAIARLMIPNIAHIKAFWIMQSVHLSQLALSWGVDDLDGTVVWYDITKREGGGGTTHQEMHVETIKRLVREAGFDPIERDTLYGRIDRESLAAAV